MGYTVCHMAKAKGGASGGLTNHIDRLAIGLKGKNIDQSKTHLNIVLIKPIKTIDQMINDRIEKGYTSNRKIRTDAIKSQRYILSGSPEEMKNLSMDELKEWSIDNYKFFAKMYGENNIVRATTHLDEKTPHMHLIVVPLINGKLSAKEYTGTKDKLKNLQTNYASEIGNKYGLERGIEGSNVSHITTKEFYRDVKESNLTANKILELPKDKQEYYLRVLTQQIGMIQLNEKNQRDANRRDRTRIKKEEELQRNIEPEHNRDKRKNNGIKM